MKKPLALLLSAILSLSLWGCSSEVEEQKNPYRPVSYKSEIFQDGVLTSYDLTEYHYDEHGFLSESLYYEGDVLKQTNIYQNDDFGNILTVTSISDDNTVLCENKLTLDDQNRVLRQEDYKDGVLSYTMEYTYDKDGNVTSEIYTVMKDGVEDHVRHKEMTYNRKGELIRTILRQRDSSYFRYDYENDRQVKVSLYDSSDELLSYEESTYNENGQLMKEASYTCQRTEDTRTNVLDSYSLYTYDETGLIVTKTDFSVYERPFQTHMVTTYDEYGNQLLQERYHDDELHWRITQTFEPIP